MNNNIDKQLAPFHSIIPISLFHKVWISDSSKALMTVSASTIKLGSAQNLLDGITDDESGYMSTRALNNSWIQIDLGVIIGKIYPAKLRIFLFQVAPPSNGQILQY